MTAPDITHLIDRSEGGSWAEVLPFCLNIKVSSSARKCGGRRGVSSPSAPATNVSFSSHTDSTSE